MAGEERSYQNKILAWLAYVVITALVLFSTYLYSQEGAIILALPMMAVVSFIVFFSAPWALILIGFFTPFSIRYKVEPLQATFSFPTEPIIGLVMGLFILKIALDWRFDTEFLKHPISLAIIFSLGWIFITTLFTTMEVVSWKFFLSRLWFVVVMYFIAAEVFKNPARIKQFLFSFTLALILLVLWGTYQHAGYGFHQELSYAAVQPFMNDHTEYGATLGFLIPVAGAFAFKAGSLEIARKQQILAAVFFVILLMGLFFSFSRAAWLGIFGSMLMLLVLWLRMNFWILIAIIAVATTLVYQNQYQILYWLKQNEQVSDTGLEEHIHSMYNITTDASNTERINRWMAAIRMYEEKPLLGWGPGTYMFQYAPFQLSGQMTKISTRVADGGDAHSEYLKALSERGIIGLLSFVLILGLVCYKAMQLHYHGRDAFIRTLAAALLLGIITFIIHGFLNNFLDYDKASVPFWSFIAIIVILDLKNKGKKLEPVV